MAKIIATIAIIAIPFGMIASIIFITPERIPRPNDRDFIIAYKCGEIASFRYLATHHTSLNMTIHPEPEFCVPYRLLSTGETNVQPK